MSEPQTVWLLEQCESPAEVYVIGVFGTEDSARTYAEQELDKEVRVHITSHRKNWGTWDGRRLRGPYSDFTVYPEEVRE